MDNKNEANPLEQKKGDTLAELLERQDAYLAKVKQDFPNVTVFSCEHVERRELPMLLFLYLGQDRRVALCRMCSRWMMSTAEEVMMRPRVVEELVRIAETLVKILDALLPLIDKSHRHWWQRQKDNGTP